jgi:hypothetical protein
MKEQEYKGKKVDEPMIHSIMKEHGCDTYRILTEDSLYSLDFSTSRVNVVLNKRKKITSVWVG